MQSAATRSDANLLRLLRPQARLLAHLQVATILRLVAYLLACLVALPPALFAQEPQSQASGRSSSRLGVWALSKAPDALWIESLIDAGAAKLAIEVCEFRLDRCVPDSNAHTQWLMLLLHSKSAALLEKLEWNSPIDPIESTLGEIAKLARSDQATALAPRSPWVRWKQLWCRRLIQQNALAAYLAVPGRKPLQEWLLKSIRIGLDELDALEQTVSKMQPDKPILSKAERERKDKTLPNEITSGEILDLRGQIELLRADLLYQRSQCYPSGSDEQIAAATQMLSSIERASSQLPATWTHRPLLSLARGEAELQLGRHPAVQKNMTELWNALAQDANPEAPEWRIGAASLAIRSARSTQQWPTAQAWLDRAGGWEKSPDLALEHLGILFQRDLNRGATPESILQLRKQISDRFGRYWEQRVDAMLVSNPLFQSDDNTGNPSLGNPSLGNPSASATMASLELFRIQARQAIAANEFEKAIEKLQQAELAASKLDTNQEAFGFAMQIAALLERTGQQTAAADEFYRTAITYPESPKASSAAMMSAWLIRQADPKLDAEAQQLQQNTYWQRLRETPLLWPHSPPAQQASELLDAHWLSTGDYVACLEFWSECLSKDPRAMNRAQRRYLLVALVTQEDWLEKPLQDGQALAKASAKLQAALLEAVKSKDQADGAQAIDAETLLAWIRSVQPHRRWSAQALPEISAPEANDSVGQLAESWNRCEEGWQKGNLDSQMLDKLEKQRKEFAEGNAGLAGSLGSRLDRFLDLARLQVVSTNPQAIKTGLEARIAKEPKSLWWVYRSARTMQRISVLSESSLGWYRQMATGVMAGSEPWLEARARTIEVLQARGEVAKATELGQLVLASYPNVAAEWKKRLGFVAP